MRILYFDIDSLRPDHLSCYGYHRSTSPNIDRVAARGIRFTDMYCSDAPCLPSRTALFTGQFGMHTGVITHSGATSRPFPDTLLNRQIATEGWMATLGKCGMHTAAISPFGGRHAAWHWYAGFREIHDTGKSGMENADEVAPVVLEWLRQNGAKDNWFLHVNFWDPHGPYRVPAEFGEPFAGEPLPSWLNEEVRQRHWQGCGPHSAREVPGFADHKPWKEPYPRHPEKIDSMQAVRRMFDGYDTGILYADYYVGQILDYLAELGIDDETAVIISADHGENLGELNIYGDHQTADDCTCHIPYIVHWPGITDNRQGSVAHGLQYHFDAAATVIEWAGGRVPGCWDGQSFAKALQKPGNDGRDHLIVSQGLWTAQRGVRFNQNKKPYICVRSYHEGYHNFDDLMLFDLQGDPHEQHNLVPWEKALVDHSQTLLENWYAGMMQTARQPVDPMWILLHEGGPVSVRGQLDSYLERLRQTGRQACAQSLAAKYAKAGDS